MDLLERYFRTLRIFLPKNQRDDIVRELAEEIRSQVAEQEAALGRPLNPDEQAAMVRQYGHPLLTAARYRPQKHLIGPVIFPYYWLVLKLTIALVFLGHVIGAGVLLAGGAPVAQTKPLLENMLATMLKVLGWTTVLGACADVWLTRSRILENWNPRAGFPPLLHVAKTVEHALSAVPGSRRSQASLLSPLSTRRTNEASLSSFVAAVVLSAWWLLGLRFPYLLFGPGAADLEWGAAIDRLYPVLVIAQLTMLAEHFSRLTSRNHTGLSRMMRIVCLITGAMFIYLFATSDHHWLVWHGAAEVAARAKIVAEIAGRQVSLIDFVNYVFSTVFGLAATVGVLRIVRVTLRWRSRRGPTTAHA